ncbi:unnamed protein product [Absidia cylindrospora]
MGMWDYYYAAPPPPHPPTAAAAGSVAGASPFMNGPGMPLPMMVNQFGVTTTPPPPPPSTSTTSPAAASTPPMLHPPQQQGYYPQHPPPPPHLLGHPQQIPTTAANNNSTPPSLQPVSIMSPSIVAATIASTANNSTPPPPPPPSAMDQEYCDFLYHAGFLQGRLADTLVDIPSIHKTYPLHALVLARSPTFHGMLVSDQTSKRTVSSGGRKRYTIRLTAQHHLPSSVTEEAVAATLGHLYWPMTHQDVMYLFARPRTLLSILDMADFLEMQPLTSMIYEALSQEWNVETILFWLPYLAPPPTTTKDEGQSASLAFGIHYLTQTLPHQLDAFYNDNFMDLAHVYAHLPLGLLEPCIEAEGLNVRDPMQRLAFAKQVMANCQQWMEMDDGLSVALRFNNGEVAVRVIHPPQPAQS